MRTSAELREGFLAFFEEKGHLRRPSASLIPRADDHSTLLTTAGMQPQMPFFLGREPPPAPLTTTVQKCFRTPDIDEVGTDGSHLTFFEMLGNFSFGQYFKEGAIELATEFVQERMRLDWDRIWVSVFAGDPALVLGPDEVTIELWEKVGMPRERIVPLPASENFWPPGGWAIGVRGPCGPDSELYYDWGEEHSCGEPVRHAGGEPGHLLHRSRDRGRDCADGGVRAVRHRDRAVRHRVELVELVVDAVDRSSGLDEDREEIALAATQERRETPERAAQPYEHVGETEPACDEEHRECVVEDVPGCRGEQAHEIGILDCSLSADRRDDACPDNRVVVVESGDLSPCHGFDRLLELEGEPAVGGAHVSRNGRRAVAQLRLRALDVHIQAPRGLDTTRGESCARSDDDGVRRPLGVQHVQRCPRADTQSPTLARGEAPVPVVSPERSTLLVADLALLGGEPLALEEAAVVVPCEEARLLALAAARGGQVRASRLSSRLFLCLPSERKGDPVEHVRRKRREHVGLVLSHVGRAGDQAAAVPLDDARVVARPQDIGPGRGRERDEPVKAERPIAGRARIRSLPGLVAGDEGRDDRRAKVLAQVERHVRQAELVAGRPGSGDRLCRAAGALRGGPGRILPEPQRDPDCVRRCPQERDGAVD